MNYKVEAIILKSRDIKEVDRIYTLFSRENGKLKIVGKGTRKLTAKLASGVEPITLSEVFLIKGKWLDKLTGVIIAEQFSHIKTNEKKLLLTKTLFEIIDAMANEKEAHEKFYEDLKIFLYLLERSSLDSQSLRLLQLGLIWKIIQWSGYQPEVFSCASCSGSLQEKDFYWFNVTTGIECARCSSQGAGKKVRIEKDTVKILRIFLSQEFALLSKLVVKEKFLVQILHVTKLILQQVLGKRVYL